MKREALNKATDIFTEAQTRMRAARNDADLRECAGLLDGPDVLALPEGAQRELSAQYRATYRRITGGLHP